MGLEKVDIMDTFQQIDHNKSGTSGRSKSLLPVEIHHNPTCHLPPTQLLHCLW